MQFFKMYPLSIVLFFVLLFSSCKDDKGVSSGTNSIAYEIHYENPVNLLDGFNTINSTSQVHINNPDLYNKIMSKVESEHTDYVNPVIQISNIRVEYMSLKSLWHINELNTYLDDCQLILQKYDANNANPERVLANFVSIDLNNDEVIMVKSQEDLTNFVMTSPDILFFNFEFNAEPPSEIEVYYRFFIGYDFRVSEG